MSQLLPFFIVILAAVFSSKVFSKLHIPWVITLILGGIAIGPHGLGIFTLNPTVEFIGQIGLVFLMFMAGLETRLESFRNFKKEISIIAFLNGAIPFIIGFQIAFWLNYGLVTSILLGIIFVSSSIAIVIPSLEKSGLIHLRIGKSITGAAIIEDITSLLALSILLQTIDPITRLPLPIFYAILIATLITLRWALPKLQWFFASHEEDGSDYFQQDLRSVFVVLIGTVVVFELLGLHPIIAGFFAGLVLSGSIKSEVLEDKLRTISYGIFIPSFFITIGAQTNLGILIQSQTAVSVTLLIVLGLIISKFMSGWLGGKLAGFSEKESLLIGSATIPQLSTTLAVAFTALELGLVSREITTALIILSVVSIFVSPVLVKLFTDQILITSHQKTT